MTRTPLSRSKGQRSTCRGGGILWRPPAQLVGSRRDIWAKLLSCTTKVTLTHVDTSKRTQTGEVSLNKLEFLSLCQPLAFWSVVRWAEFSWGIMQCDYYAMWLIIRIISKAVNLDKKIVKVIKMWLSPFTSSVKRRFLLPFSPTWRLPAPHIQSLMLTVCTF